MSPYIENQLYRLIGLHHLNIDVYGKRTGHVPVAGENSSDNIADILSEYLGLKYNKASIDLSDAPALPVRPPVLCAGCPHRASFYAVKKAMKGQKAYFCGDIGCYTLGAVAPLNAMDLNVCMGASCSGLHGFNLAMKEGLV